jgi:hypothetical protein
MKFKRKPLEIEAEQYHEGLEDGFLLKYRDPKNDLQLNWYPSSIGEEPVKIPYIKTRYGGHKRLREGDWILISKDGQKDVWDNNKFMKNWEPVDSN